MENAVPGGSSVSASTKKRRWSDSASYADQLVTRCETDPALDVPIIITAVGKGSPTTSRSSASSTSSSSSPSPQNSANNNNKKRRRDSNDPTTAGDRDAGQLQRQVLLPQRRSLPIWEGAVPPLAPVVCAALCRFPLLPLFIS
jgi:hypothetical protein